jgi:hypothetical protein
LHLLLELGHQVAGGTSGAALFKVLTPPFDNNRFQVHNVGVVGSAPQARLAH